jgi:hypothetical protein
MGFKISSGRCGVADGLQCSHFIDSDEAMLYSVIKGKIEDVELPVDHVDVIISEWMVRCNKTCSCFSFV